MGIKITTDSFYKGWIRGKKQGKVFGAAMAEQEYFKSALSDFTYEAASGGAIRHLTDLGYSVKQICEQLSFPTPYVRVQKTVWQQLIATGVVLTEEPGSIENRKRGKTEYIMERDKYGRSSFRMVTVKEEDREPICWKDRRFEESGRSLAAYLARKCMENDGAAYISCEMGMLLQKNPSAYEEMLLPLDERQREYLSGLPWEPKLCYHRLDKRMQEIAGRLYAAGRLTAICYFMKSGERVTFDSATKADTVSCFAEGR